MSLREMAILPVKFQQVIIHDCTRRRAGHFPYQKSNRPSTGGKNLQLSLAEQVNLSQTFKLLQVELLLVKSTCVLFPACGRAGESLLMRATSLKLLFQNPVALLLMMLSRLGELSLIPPDLRDPASLLHNEDWIFLYGYRQ